MALAIPRTACLPCRGIFLQLRRCLISAGAVAGRVCADRVFVGRQLPAGTVARWAVTGRCLLSGCLSAWRLPGDVRRNSSSRRGRPLGNRKKSPQARAAGIRYSESVRIQIRLSFSMSLK